jgi:hypothetical protein
VGVNDDQVVEFGFRQVEGGEQESLEDVDVAPISEEELEDEVKRRGIKFFRHKYLRPVYAEGVQFALAGGKIF